MTTTESVLPRGAPLCVLLVDDSVATSARVTRELRRLGRALLIERVETADELRAAVERRAWDVAITSWTLARFSGPAAMALLRLLDGEVPSIVVADARGEEGAVEAMRAGARDYVITDDLARLAPAVERELRERTTRRARLLAEAGRAEADLRFRRFFEAGVTGVTVTELDGTVVEANDTFLRIVGYGRADLEARAINLETITPADLRPMHVEKWRELARCGSVQPYEKAYLRKDGSRVPALVGVALLDHQRILTIVTDLSERKRFEDALEERALSSALVAEVSLALTTGDALGDVLRRSCERLVEAPGVALARVWTVAPARQSLELRASAGITTEIDGPAAHVAVGERDVGLVAAERRARVSANAATDPLASDPDLARAAGLAWSLVYPLQVGGHVVGVLAIGAREPLSEPIAAAVMTAADGMAVRIRGQLAEESKASLEEQLRQSQKMEAIGRLAGGVAHDFNNLLSVVLSYSDLLLEDMRPDDPLRGGLEEIRRAGTRATELTRRLLMFSRQHVAAPEVLRVDELLSSMTGMLRRLLGEDIAFSAHLPPALGSVRVDRSALEQVVMNLVVNARDAMPRGGRVTIEAANATLDEEFARTHLGVTPGAHVLLAVTDSGIGMDHATQKRIFEPFFTTKEQGTGLGLSTVFGIVQQSGGTIWVESEPGVGTTFKIYLPRVDTAPSVPVGPAVAASRGGSETILVVEDEEPVRSVACDMLQRHGYRVLEASTAQHAIAVCRAHEGRIDLLLSDVVMPGMSGPALAVHLRLARPGLRVLCMSGYTDDATVRHGVLDEAFAYLQKPLTVDSLTRKVRELLDAGDLLSGS